MTKLCTLLCTALAVASRGVAAQDSYNGGAYMPPAVASAMSAMSASFDRYVHPTPAVVATVSAAAGPDVNVDVKTAKCSYWLDNIKHQGVAAFQSNSSMH